MSEDRSQKSEDGKGEKSGRVEIMSVATVYGKIKTIKDLEVYRAAYKLAMDIYEATKQFPKEEIYSLTDQIRRSSRSASINIREGYAKRRYAQLFIRHLNDALGSSEETRGWLEHARDCGYLSEAKVADLDKDYDRLSAMLYSLMNKWEKL